MAANFTPIGINFSALNNLTLPDFGFTNLTKSEFIDYIPQNANAVTNDYYGLIVLVILLIFLLWFLTDVSQYGYLRYNSTRAFGIALGITSTIGIVMLSINYAVNFIHIGIMVALFIILLVYTILANPT
jgi:hypothetical protein